MDWQELMRPIQGNAIEVVLVAVVRVPGEAPVVGTTPRYHKVIGGDQPTRESCVAALVDAAFADVPSLKRELLRVPVGSA